MSIIKCRECGNDVSTKAATCPKCGAKVTHGLNWQQVTLGLILGIGAIAWLSSGHSTNNTQDSLPNSAFTSPPRTPAREIFRIDASDLFDAYNRNEVATDDQLKGKIVEVSGIVQSISKDFTDGVVIGLMTTNQFMPARLAMKDSEKATAASLERGQPITIRCERMRRIVGSPSGNSCTFFQPAREQASAPPVDASPAAPPINTTAPQISCGSGGCFPADNSDASRTAADEANARNREEAQAVSVAAQSQTPKAVEEQLNSGPSFNCTKATTQVEFTICGNAELSALDRKMVAAYRGALASATPGDASKIKTDGAQWRTAVRDKCVTVDCVRSAYALRLRELSQ